MNEDVIEKARRKVQAKYDKAKKKEEIPAPDDKDFKLEAKQPCVGGVYECNKWPNKTIESLNEVLSLTIKKDDTIKKIAFLAQLLTYTDNDQFNLSFNGPSSSGKSYIALEVASLFPEEDLIEVSYASPTAFWHSAEDFDEERQLHVVNLERKILIFIDQPHPQVLERLRSLLSHDKKEVMAMITDRNKSGGNRAKKTVIRGYCSAIFASASLYMDEQEQTRFILLSPQTTKRKMKLARAEALKRASDRKKYFDQLNSNQDRNDLKERIRDIKEARVKEIIIHNQELIAGIFTELHPKVKSRHSRDISRVAGLAKAWALYNLWDRDYVDGIIKTKDEDILVAFDLWKEISLSQQFGIPPYLLNLYQDVIWKTYISKDKQGLTRKDIQSAHFKRYERHLPESKLRYEILPMLETSGLLSQEHDEAVNKQTLFVFPKVDIAEKKKSKSAKLEELRTHIHPPHTRLIKNSIEANNEKPGVSETLSLPQPDPGKTTEAEDLHSEEVDTDFINNLKL